MKYRAEIDGLRAVAVLSVVAFHAFPTWLSGGFVGVDIFFVISGFLITTHIFEKLAKDEFSFTDFFGRRIRRIFPALIFVLSSALIFGWFGLVEEEYSQLGKHVAGGSAFIANFIFVNEIGYFDNAAETKPMLHLWSLAVEEQFYIFWPLVLWISWKARLNLFYITIFVGLVSLFYNIVFVSSSSIEMYFLPFGRFWEILCGSALAWILLNKDKIFKGKFAFVFSDKNDSKTAAQTAFFNANLVSFIGFALLFLGFILINKSFDFPGTWALLPVLGTILIISVGSRASLSRVALMNPIAVWIGLISYPLYLWHWTILSFLRIQKGSQLDVIEVFYAILASFILSWITYAFLEKFIRRKGFYAFKNLTLIASMVVIGILGLMISNGTISKYKTKKHTIDHARMLEICDSFIPDWKDNKDFKCKLQSDAKDISVALIGDSHVEHLFYGLVETSKSSGENYALFPSSCQSPLLNVSSGFRDKDEKITIMRKKGHELISKATKFAGETANVHSVILAHNPFCDSVIKDNENPSLTTLSKIYSNGFQRTLDYYKKTGKKVYIVIDNPRLPFDPNTCVSRGFNFFESRCDFVRDEIGTSIKMFNTYEDVAKQFADRYDNVSIINLKEVFCTKEKCSPEINGVLMYKDRGHLNINGSRYVSKIIEKELAKH